MIEVYLVTGFERASDEERGQIGWKLLPVSAAIELAAVILFALNLIGTLTQRLAHLCQPDHPVSNTWRVL